MTNTKIQMVKKGLKHCLVSYHDDEYDDECADCPYLDPDIEVLKCKQYLLDDALEVLNKVTETTISLTGWGAYPKDWEGRDNQCHHFLKIC